MCRSVPDIIVLNFNLWDLGRLCDKSLMER